jgi:hypothetical protein
MILVLLLLKSLDLVVLVGLDLLLIMVAVAVAVVTQEELFWAQSLAPLKMLQFHLMHHSRQVLEFIAKHLLVEMGLLVVMAVFLDLAMVVILTFSDKMALQVEPLATLQ